MKNLLFVFWVLTMLLAGCVQPANSAQASMNLNNDGENMLTELNYLYSIQFPAHWMFFDTDALNEQRRTDWAELGINDIEVQDLQNTAMFIVPIVEASRPEDRTIPHQENNVIIYHSTSAAPFSRRVHELLENYTGGVDFGQLEQIYLDGVGAYRFTEHLPGGGFSVTYYWVPLPGNSIATFTMGVPTECLEDMADFHSAMETLAWIR